MSATDASQVEDLAGSISRIIGALLVSGRKGQPAEGMLPFNPLYFHLLRQVASENGCRPSMLAERLGVSRTTISTAVQALHRRDLLETEKDPSDGRAMIVRLTGEGSKVVEAILRQDRRNAEAMLSTLAEGERDHFVRYLKRVAQGLALDNGPPEQS